MDFLDGLKKVGQSIANGVKKVTSGVSNAVKNVVQGVTSSASSIVKGVTAVTTGNWSGALQSVAEIGQNFVTAFTDDEQENTSTSTSTSANLVSKALSDSRSILENPVSLVKTEKKPTHKTWLKNYKDNTEELRCLGV